MSTRAVSQPGARELWREAGEFARQHPELLATASRVGDFGAGARWMHAAMIACGWRLPAFGDEAGHARRGWLKYALCLTGAALTSAIAFTAFATVLACSGETEAPEAGLAWRSLAVAIAAAVGGLAFYAVEAQAVFLFPESLRGSRRPWASSRALAVAAGGTGTVVKTVLPVAACMLAGRFRRPGLVASWAQGCLAIVLWHRRVALARTPWVTSTDGLPKLEIGPVNPLLLRREHIEVGLTGGFRVLWISDLHWRGDSDLACLLAILLVARRERPGVCVLGGDLIEHAAAAPLVARLVKSLARQSTCLVLPGNHDRRHLADLRARALASGARWLPDHEYVEVRNSSGERLHLQGAVPVRNPAVSPDVRVSCIHDPADWRPERFAPTDRPQLVLAGHLHGGQVVWRADRGRLLPAGWFYKHAWLRQNRDGVEVVVGRGAGDTFPVRWRCPRELILCELR